MLLSMHGWAQELVPRTVVRYVQIPDYEALAFGHNCSSFQVSWYMCPGCC